MQSQRLRAGLVLFAVLSMISGLVAAGEPLPRTKVGDLAHRQWSSEHPYPAGEVQTFEIEHPGASYIKVHFSRFELAPGDRLEILSADGSERYVFEGRGYKQKGEDFWGNSVLGDKAILRLHSATGGGHGFDVDYYAFGIAPLFDEDPGQIESVCGSNDWQDVACYQSSYPTEFDRAKRAVVVLYNGTENCTGVKVGCPNQILTNEHCVTSQAEVNVTEVRFEFQRADCNGSSTSFSEAYLGDLFIQDNYTLDYSLITVLGASDNYEAAEIDPRLPPVGERLYITGHPAGNPKKLSLEDTGSPTGLCQADISPVDGRGTDTDLGYYCDTTGGSSGSPVWSGDSHKLVALHHFGGCPNSGVRMDLIHPEIADLITSCCDLPPNRPTLGATVSGDNQIDLSWDDSALPTVVEYRILRSRSAGGPYAQIAVVADSSPGLPDGPAYDWADTTVSGDITYFYVVRSSDGATCTSEDSTEASATATGACTLEPVFGGLLQATAPPLGICTVDLAWVPGADECGGPLNYNVYRSTDPAFVPGPTNLIAGGLTATVFSDFDQLIYGTSYHYVVRAVDLSNGSEDGNTVRISASPADAGGAACTTVSACPDNPFVDVQPEFATSCAGDGQTLTAVTAGGNGPFEYQWLLNGVPVAGATGPTYVPTELGNHAYNVEVRAASCGSPIFDGQDSSIELVNAPFFGGVTSAANSQTTTCGLDIGWNAASTVCAGPLRYFVYRDTVSPVIPDTSNLVAGGVTGTLFTDSAGLVNRQDYHYLVRAQDASTGQFDGNVVEVSAFPDGPGSGPQAVLDEDFEDPASFAGWTVTTGPGIHTCGEWALSSNGAKRPTGGSGSYAIADNLCNPLLGRTSTTMTSPPVAVNLANMIGITLEYDIWYNKDGSETGSVEVYDGSSWVTVWQDSGGDVNGHRSIDVWQYAAGNPAFQVRFDYQDATQDQFFSVDNVQVIALVDVSCETAAVGPATVADGRAGSDPLIGGRATLSGDMLDLSWDTAACGSTEYNLIYGDLADVASATIAGSECGLSGAGNHSWSGVPSGDLFFMIVGNDGTGTEGGWGTDYLGAERGGWFSSGECGAVAKDASNSCP